MTDLNQVAKWIEQSQSVVAFTGAGISTPSGIPDFRSPESGMWENADPMEVASIFGFRQNPQAFYDWVRPLTSVTLEAEPNPAHYALVKLEQAGKLDGIITQNIDMLHTRAGNQVVHELHGHLRSATCIMCFREYDGEALMTQFIEDGIAPTCPVCGGAIKPDVILFGEQLPYEPLQAAKKLARSCDLMLVIGSSLEVAPASDIPLIAKRNNAKVTIINKEPTALDSWVDIALHDDAALVLPEIIHCIQAISG